MDNYLWFSVFVAVNSLLLTLLAANVSRLRLKHKISAGDGGNKELFKAIRVHINGIEQVPIFALLLLAAIFVQQSSAIVAIAAVLFTVSRVLHAVGMLYRIHIFRRVGAGLTYFLQIAVAISILIEIIF
jgi:uncharacterized membrane protein YecN with MAPEG domain